MANTTRRSFFGALAGLAALIPGVARAQRGDSPPGDGFPVPSGFDFKSLSYVPSPVQIKEGWLDIMLNGEVHHVHRIHMTVGDGLDRTGGLAMLFDIPKGRKVHGHPSGVTVLPDTRRIIFPMFEYDQVNEVIIGEDGKTTLEERLVDVIDSANRAGFDCSPAGFKNGHTVWATQDGPNFEYPKHAMGHLPYELLLDDLHLITPIRMVRATVIRG